MSRTFPALWRPAIRVLTVALALALAAGGFAAPAPGTTPSPADPIVLTIDGEPVSAAEYTLVMNGRVSEVFTYFHAKDGREDRLGYWKDDGGPENPIRKLRELTNAEFRRIKTVQAFAKKNGIANDVSYAAFKEGLLKENARRAQARANNEIIYGPSQYQEHRYYYFRLADLRQAALESFTKAPENAVPASVIEAFYAANQDHFKATPLSDARDQIARALQKKAFEKLLEDKAANARLEIRADALAAIAPRHDP